MAEKSSNSSSRRYHTHIDEENNHQQLLPILIDSHKRRRSSITNEQRLLSNSDHDFIYNRDISMTTSTIRTRKRSAQDDMINYATQNFLQEHEQYVRNRFLELIFREK